MNLTELAQEIFEANNKKGFWDQRSKFAAQAADMPEEERLFIKSAIRDQMLMLIVSELSESVEAARKGRFCDMSGHSMVELPEKDEVFRTYFASYVKDSFEDEIADALIRILDLCGGLGIDIDWHVRQKLRYNSLRPRLHGKAY